MRFWFSDEGLSETQMCRLARAIAFRTNDTQNLPVGPHTTLVGGGGGGGYLFSCSLVPLKYFGSFPCSPSLNFLMFPVTQYCLFFSPFSLEIWPLFPCTAEINALFHWYPNPRGWPHITVSIILFGTVTIKFFPVFFGLIF